MNSEFFRYPTVTEQDRAWGLYVTGGGFVSVAPKSPYPLEVHPPSYQFRWPQRRVLDEYQMFLIARGEGEFESGAGGRRPIKRGNVAITFPGQWHRYRPVPSVGWDQYWIGFRGEIADRLLHRGLLRAELPVLDVPLDETVMRPFQRLLTCLQNDPPGAHQLMAGSIIEILGATLAAARAGRHPDREAEMVQQAKVLLERKSEDNPTIEAIARQLEISGTHFRRVFKRQTGMSPYQYQLQ
ncbi:MAG: AraC family ligand binding domain-containing protein, partial [bacterium]